LLAVPAPYQAGLAIPARVAPTAHAFVPTTAGGGTQQPQLQSSAAPTSGDGPTVVSVRRFGFHNLPTVLVLQFSKPLDPARAANLGNYFLRNFKSRPVPIDSAVYNPATRTVVLRPGQRLDLRPAQL